MDTCRTAAAALFELPRGEETLVACETTGNKESVGLIFTGVWKTIDIQRKRTNDAASRADLLQESFSVNMITCHAFLPKVYVAIKRKEREGKKNSTKAMSTFF